MKDKTERRMVQVTMCNLLNNEYEDDFLSYLISSMDFNTPLAPLISKQLKQMTEEFIEKVQSRITTKFYNYDQLFEEIYYYLHKSIIRNSFKYSFYDNNIENTKNIYTSLYNVVKESVNIIENKYKMAFIHQQIAALTLIFRKNVMKNKLLGRNRKRIVIVSNSAIEKIDFFIEILKINTDIEVIAKININELYTLKELKYDMIICFSNRIKTLLEFNGYENIKLNFYLTHEDIDKLLALGVSAGGRKVKVETLLDEIEGKSREEIKKLLLTKYEPYFLNS